MTINKILNREETNKKSECDNEYKNDLICDNKMHMKVHIVS